MSKAQFKSAYKKCLAKGGELAAAPVSNLSKVFPNIADGQTGTFTPSSIVLKVSNRTNNAYGVVKGKMKLKGTSANVKVLNGLISFDDYDFPSLDDEDFEEKLDKATDSLFKDFNNKHKDVKYAFSVEESTYIDRQGSEQTVFNATSFEEKEAVRQN